MALNAMAAQQMTVQRFRPRLMLFVEGLCAFRPPARAVYRRQAYFYIPRTMGSYWPDPGGFSRRHMLRGKAVDLSPLNSVHLTYYLRTWRRAATSIIYTWIAIREQLRPHWLT